MRVRSAFAEGLAYPAVANEHEPNHYLRPRYVLLGAALAAAVRASQAVFIE